MTVLMTGFPGFLGSVLPAILKRVDSSAICLVQPKFATLAERRVAELSTADPFLEGRIQLVEGDITQPGLGLAADALTGVTEAWHLAAVYDLAVARDVAVRINVDGTRNVLDTLECCPKLTRLHYFSTCYVSGRYPGPFGENDLEVGAPFNNYTRRPRTSPRRMCDSTCPPACRRRSIAPQLSSVTVAPVKRRSSTAPTSSCSGCCDSPGTRSCQWRVTRRRRG